MARVAGIARIAFALSLSGFAASFPPLRIAVLDWIVAADILPGLALAGPGGA